MMQLNALSARRAAVQASCIPRPMARGALAARCSSEKPKPVKQAMVATMAASLLSAGSAHAEKIGEFNGSGFLFKDNVEVAAIDDDNVSGVTIYLSEFQRNLADKLKKDFFTEPSQASLTCAITGPVKVKDLKQLTVSGGAEVFSEKKGLNLFQDKTLRIRRLFDAKRNTVVYVAYSTRLSSASDDGAVSAGRYRTSICALGLPAEATAPPAAVE